MLLGQVSAQLGGYGPDPNFPNPLGGPNELRLGYPPLMGKAYTGNFTTPASRGDVIFGELGVVYGRVAIDAEAEITTAKYPNATLFSGPYAFDFGRGNLYFYVQLTIVSYPETGYNSTWVGLNYNVTYTDYSGNSLGNASTIAAELDRFNYTIQLTGPIYLPKPTTLTNRTCERWVPDSYNCRYTLRGGAQGAACGSQLSIPVTSQLSYNYLFPAGYIGFGNNGTLQNMLRPVWGIGVSRDVGRTGGVSSTWSCNQFRQARVDSSGNLVASAATKVLFVSSRMAYLTMTIMIVVYLYIG